MTKESIDPNKVYTTQEAADVLGVSEQILVMQLRNGKITGQYIGKGWKILGQNIIDFLKKPQGLIERLAETMLEEESKSDSSNKQSPVENAVQRLLNGSSTSPRYTPEQIDLALKQYKEKKGIT